MDGEKERINKSNLCNEFYKKRIEEVGINKLLKELKEAVNKNSINSISNSYEGFKKDLKAYPYSAKLSEQTYSLIKTINGNKDNLPIFEVENDDIEYNIKFPIIPFSKFYIATNIYEEIDKELYNINGFFVLDFDKDFLYISFFWSRTINDGWKLCSFLQRKNGLIESFDENKCDFSEPDVEEIFGKEIQLMAMKRFNNLMRKIIYKINKKEYTSYKKYSFGNYEEKEIVFDYDVRSHLRHFWEDTGYFNIPKMSKEEQLKKGYGINELVFKDGELRKDVPFRIIANFSVGIEKIEENRIYDLIEKKHLRQEERLYKILRKIFPNNFIRRHNRTVLKGLELDFNLPELRLGIEYDGEQHFDKELYNKLYGEGFEEQVKRDKLKEKLCNKKKIKLIRIKYDEPLNISNIKKKLKARGI